MNAALSRRDAAMQALARLTPAMRDAICELFFAIPRHQSCLHRYGVRAIKLHALQARSLARRVGLVRIGGGAAMAFWTLTAAGADVARAEGVVP